MYIEPFAVEEWMNAWESGAKYNIAETCVDSLSVDELFALTGEDKAAFLEKFCTKKLTYGYIEGSPQLKEGICSLYRHAKPEHIVPVHGAAGANHHLFYSLISPKDRVISIMPAYQQIYSIPKSLQADVKILKLRKENGYLPDLDELKSLAVPGTKMICMNNPNNPTGALMDKEFLKEIIAVAQAVDAYVLCDEVYRHLTQEEIWSDSVADLYEKGISVGSMSKVFSLAGLRIGWIASRDKEVVRQCMMHRDYNLISCGMFDDALAAVALKHSGELIARSRKIVRENLEILDAWVQKEAHISYRKPQAGSTALLHYDLDAESYVFCRELYEKTGVLLVPGDCFGEPHSVRAGYAGSSRELKEGLQAVSTYLYS